mgnify:CR=1 FL=1
MTDKYKNLPISNKYGSWGNLYNYKHQVFTPLDSDELGAFLKQNTKKVLVYGKGRSYGDMCLNDNQVIIDMSNFLILEKSL